MEQADADLEFARRLQEEFNAEAAATGVHADTTEQDLPSPKQGGGTIHQLINLHVIKSQ